MVATQQPSSPPPKVWQTSRYAIDLERPKVMAIINITPDSFSDGGVDAHWQQTLQRCEAARLAGADILDLGAESTRPGATSLSAEVEWARLWPVLKVVLTWGIPVSVDTYQPETMRRALGVGVDIINDIWALRREGALATVAAHPSCGICLMHMHGEPQTMQITPMPDPPTTVVTTIKTFLNHRMQEVMASGIQAHRVVLDPGFGFGKTVAQNKAILQQQSTLTNVPCSDAPHAGWLVGYSRKSTLGVILGQPDAPRPVSERVHGSVAAALLAVQRGAHVVRVHDVLATVDALRLWQAMS